MKTPCRCLVASVVRETLFADHLQASPGSLCLALRYWRSSEVAIACPSDFVVPLMRWGWLPLRSETGRRLPDRGGQQPQQLFENHVELLFCELPISAQN
jgi:hypothetical protein